MTQMMQRHLEQLSIGSMSKQWRTKLICPHCSKELAFELNIQTDATFPEEIKTLPTYARPRAERFSLGDLKLIEELEAMGMLTAFSNCVRLVKNANAPKDIEAYLLYFLRRAQPSITPKESLNILIQQFPNTLIKVYSAESIVLVTSSGRPVLFAPEVYIKMSRNKQREAQGTIIRKLPYSVKHLEEWIRTRNGFVAGKGLLWEELKGRTAGGFAIPGI